jgi:hypothetical protein
MGGSLLVSDEDMLDFATGFPVVKFIIEGQNGTTRVAENVFDTMTPKAVN